MYRFTNSFVASSVILVAAAAPQIGQAQASSALAAEEEAVAATIAAVQYLITEVDTLETVSWPSAKSLLARRPGTVVLSGISIRGGEHPARAIALAERVAAALNSQGIASRTVPRSDARYCGIGNSHSCSLPENVGLSLLIGYPSASDSAYVARVTMVTDSTVRSGRPVVSLDIVVQVVDSVWTVSSVRRTTILFD